MERLRAIEREGLKTNIPNFSAGDTVRVMVRVREGEKERLQAFEGICIARRGGGISESFTVRKISAGVGVERIFPLHSPRVKDIVVTRAGKVRRSKLYFLRDRMGKQTRVQELLGDKARREREFEKAMRASIAGDEAASAGPARAASVAEASGAEPVQVG